MVTTTKTFEPTDEQRETVEQMIAYGIPLERVAECIRNPKTKRKLSVASLKKIFKDEVERAEAQAIHAVASSLFAKATSNHPQAVTAGIFFLKARAGWQDKLDVNLSGEIDIADRMKRGEERVKKGR